MKIIDLLNKIANNEEVPKKIKYKGDIYIYYERLDDMFNYKTDDKRHIYLEEKYYIENILNDEVEIIEETKKIEKWGEGALEEMENCTDYKIEDLQKYIRILAETQNELIDEINNLKGND